MKLCVHCLIPFSSVDCLVYHLQASHNFDLEPVNWNFDSEAEMTACLKSVERTEFFKFIQIRNRQTRRDGASYETKSCNRPMVGLGSLSQPKSCPAYVKIIRTTDGKCNVTGNLAHYGHGLLIDKPDPKIEAADRDNVPKHNQSKPSQVAVDGEEDLEQQSIRKLEDVIEKLKNHKYEFQVHEIVDRFCDAIAGLELVDGPRFEV